MSSSLSKKIRLIEPTSIIAHQLKSPLSVIKVYLEVLVSGVLGELNSKQKQYLEDCIKNLVKILEVTEDLLDVSKIESQAYEIDRRPFDLVALTKSIIDDLTVWARAWRCNLILHNPGQLPPALSDYRKISKVIKNLISNGIIYRTASREGTVEISIKLQGNKILFSCRDDGMGIKSSDTKKIFTKFFRSEKSVQIEPVGTGIGLYIDKAVIENNGGKMWFKRNLDQGTTFYFTLPIALK